MIEWESVEPISVTFEASDGFADWLNALKKMSITELDVVGLHDRATGVKREFVAIDRVLKIIEQMKAENNETNGEPIRTHFEIEYNDFRDRVLALKGGGDDA